MKEVNEMTVDCPYHIDANGNLKSSTANIEAVNGLYELKNMAMKLDSKSIVLDGLIYVLEVNLVRFPNPDWLSENRKKLRENIFSMPDLKVLDTDTSEVKNQKLIIAAKLIELIDA